MTEDRIKTFYTHTSPNGSTDNAKIKFCKDDLRFVLDMAMEAARAAEAQRLAPPPPAPKPASSKKNTKKSA